MAYCHIINFELLVCIKKCTNYTNVQITKTNYTNVQITQMYKLQKHILQFVNIVVKFELQFSNVQLSSCTVTSEVRNIKFWILKLELHTYNLRNANELCHPCFSI